jgi:hypothetical protein
MNRSALHWLPPASFEHHGALTLKAMYEKRYAAMTAAATIHVQDDSHVIRDSVQFLFRQCDPGRRCLLASRQQGMIVTVGPCAL